MSAVNTQFRFNRIKWERRHSKIKTVPFTDSDRLKSISLINSLQINSRMLQTDKNLSILIYVQ